MSTAVRPAPARPLKPARPPWIPLFPTLWPSMVRPRAVGQLPFPLNDATRRDFMFARYGILAIAQALALEGREVLFPAFFHCVELEALLAAGARVKFFAVDSNLRIDPEDIASRIGPRTAALYVIHYAGFPAPIRELRDLCRDAGLALIEDCAHALLSSSDGQPLGSFGDAAAFSLPKSLPTSDGGVAVLRAGWPQASGSGTRPSRSWLAAHTASMVLSNLHMRQIPAAAMVRNLGLRLGKAAYSASGSSYVPMGTPNFDLSLSEKTMSGISSRVVLAQDFAAIVASRRRNYRYLLAELDGVVKPIFPELPDGVCPLFYPFRVDEHDAFMAGLRAEAVRIGEFWPERHRLSPESEFPAVADLHDTVLWLPCHQDLTLEALDHLVTAVRRAAGRYS